MANQEPPSPQVILSQAQVHAQRCAASASKIKCENPSTQEVAQRILEWGKAALGPRILDITLVEPEASHCESSLHKLNCIL